MAISETKGEPVNLVNLKNGREQEGTHSMTVRFTAT